MDGSENFFKTRRLELPGLRGEKATQREIGDALGMTGQTVAQWELGNMSPPIARVDALAAVYKVSRRRMLDEIAAQAERIAEKKLATAGGAK